MAWKYEKLVQWINENKGKILTTKAASEQSGAEISYVQDLMKFFADKTGAESLRVGKEVAYVFSKDITKEITEEYLQPKRASANKGNGKSAECKEIVMPQKHPLLPAWFTERMMCDVWSFGLLLTSGAVVGVACIYDIVQAADGSLWADVELLPSSFKYGEKFDQSIIGAPTERTTATICLNHVVAALELAYT